MSLAQISEGNLGGLCPFLVGFILGCHKIALYDNLSTIELELLNPMRCLFSSKLGSG